ncbi:hypothetical protein SERLA73DRAFT_52893 [Serpula lacrymans var. lacrymans S7.3]|uniref:Cyclopropane fatty acid synthase n=1 Tax=Serpula lacrymans var. lacrymans (strain S7.3) TaxID=936435 RepID=F8PVD0_SERL3|nr:hypothetical protein SERLA73DRAFT_52893 [Serpula lacrymans var. lacrymans S7.3]
MIPPFSSHVHQTNIFLARSRVLSTLAQGVIKGQLIIEDISSAESHQFGTCVEGRPPVVLKVVSQDMWARILLSNDLGVSEAYMQGDFDVSSLKAMFDLWLDNRHALSNLSSTFSFIFALFSAVAIKALGRQNLTMARWNAEVAYDTSNDFFKCFLSKEMMYSCAIWGEEENGVRGDLTIGPTPGDLESAQHRKIHHLLKKARARAGDRLLEIGSGWGALAIEAARLGCTVDTVTLSVEQKAMTEERAAAAGFSDCIRVHLCDYRKLPESFKGQFDAFVSSEMFEAVGPKHHGEYFSMMDWALKEDRAAAVITATTQAESRYTDYQPDDFARHYHWPNCHLPSATSFAVAVQAAVPGRFVLESIEDHGIHYPRTLREWGRRLEKNFNSKVVEHMKERFPQLCDEKNLEAFRRKWMYMFTYAEAGYAKAYTSLNCWTLARPVSYRSHHWRSCSMC